MKQLIRSDRGKFPEIILRHSYISFRWEQFHWQKEDGMLEAYLWDLWPSQILMMMQFYENSLRFLVVNYFLNKVPSSMFEKVLNNYVLLAYKFWFWKMVFSWEVLKFYLDEQLFVSFWKYPFFAILNKFSKVTTFSFLAS